MHKPILLIQGKSLSNYCTYGIGGPAKYLCEVDTKEALSQALFWAKQANEKVIVIGKGSNILFDDKGFNGLVIVNKIQGITWEEATVRVASGYSFSLLGIQASRKGYTGLEFASGIPGSVGGAIYMNAGAGGSEVKDVVEEIEWISNEGRRISYLRNEIAFSYRTSAFQTMQGVILSALFRLTKAEGAKEKQEKLLAYRMATQPYKERSCGSVFRNPPGDFAGRIIESLGLKELSQGGAKISPMHANFIVNQGEATAKDVLHLIQYIQEKVRLEIGVLLETEVKYIPFDDTEKI